MEGAVKNRLVLDSFSREHLAARYQLREHLAARYQLREHLAARYQVKLGTLSCQVPV
jgi:hypothetical protein